MLKDSTVTGYLQLQKYLLSIGATYILISDAQSWQRNPVLMNLAPQSAFGAGNLWLIVPWDEGSDVSLTEWIRGFYTQSSVQPNLTLIVTSSRFEEDNARQMKRDLNRRVGVYRVDQQRVFGDPQAERKLEHFFDPTYAGKYEQLDLSRTVEEWSAKRTADRNFYALLFQRTPRVYFTTALVAVNAAVFLAMAVVSRTIFFNTDILLLWGANYGPYIHAGQWWRLFAAAFIHVNLLHIFFNMWCLWNLGALAERAYGNNRFLLVYFLSALGGSLASIWFHPQIVSAGASGAVFGISGCLVGYLWKNKLHVPPGVFSILKRNMIQFIGFNVLFGLVTPSIDNAAHIGGLITGFLVGALLNPSVLSSRDL